MDDDGNTADDDGGGGQSDVVKIVILMAREMRPKELHARGNVGASERLLVRPAHLIVNHVQALSRRTAPDCTRKTEQVKLLLHTKQLRSHWSVLLVSNLNGAKKQMEWKNNDKVTMEVGKLDY